MTNALAQNMETKNTNAADLLMQAVDVSAVSKTQENSTSKFSNFLNNLDSRTTKAQNEFDQKAKVTNTSSVNRKALEKKEPINNSEIINKKINKDPRKVYEKPVQPKEPRHIETQSIKKEVSKNNVGVTKNNTTSTKDQEISQIKTDNLDKLSDINNSSPVESSPVFSSDKVKIDEEIKIEIEENIENVEQVISKIAEILPVISENTTNIKEELKNDIEELISNIENTTEISKIIENISSNLDNFNLTQEQKDEISQNIETIEELLNTDIDFEQISTELKNILQTLEPSIKKTEISIPKETINAEVKVETNVEIKTTNDVEIQPQKETLETSTEKENNINIQEASKETIKNIEKLIKDIKEAIENKDFEKLDEIIKTIPKEIENTATSLKDALSSVGEKQAVGENDLSKKLDSALKELSKSLEKVFEKTELNSENLNINSNTVEVDFTQNTNTKTQEIVEVLDKLSSEDFKNIDTTDKKSMDEILKALEDVQNATSIDFAQNSEDIKAQIETLIKNINENKISSEDLTKALDDLTQEVKTEIEKQDTTLTNNENTVDLVSKFEKFNNNQNSNSNPQNQNNETYDFTKDKNIELAKNEFDFSNTDIDLNDVELKGQATKNIDIENVEQNLQKTIAMQEMLDEMMVEVNIKTIPSNSGALSVADEIAKLAIGESSPLNTTTPINGSITYDSTGVNAIIKNAANLIKTAPTQTNSQAPSMDEVLNQVTNKITQLKDGATQKLTMVLRPNDLGRLSIELISNQNGLTTQIMAQNENVRAYIEKNIDSLRQQLSEAGVNVNNIQIKTAGSEGSTTNYEGNQNFLKDQEESSNQQNNKDNQNNQKNDNKDAKEALASISNYDMQFAKDFSSILNKSLNYNLN